MSKKSGSETSRRGFIKTTVTGVLTAGLGPCFPVEAAPGLEKNVDSALPLTDRESTIAGFTGASHAGLKGNKTPQKYEEKMKTVTAILSMLMFSGIASAQSPDPSKWMCRNLADSGGFAYQGETVFGSQACRPIPQAAPATSAAPAPKQDAGIATVSGSVAAPVVPATPQPAPAAAPAPAASPAAVSDGKTRVFVTDSQSWETRGGSAAGGNKSGWGGSSWLAGGARPQTAEIIKTLNQRCPEITVTNNLQKADFVLTLDHEGGKGLLSHHNKVAVFNRDGDDIFSASTRELGNSVKDACRAMLNSKR